MNSTNGATSPKSRIDDSRCQWLGTRARLQSPKNDTIGSIKQFNNSWYKGDAGERPEGLSKGRISPERAVRKDAWERQDKYTKSRNPANDGNRYTYIDDCSDEIRRDLCLRFAMPPGVSKTDPRQYTVLPELGRRTATNSAYRPLESANNTIGRNGSSQTSSRASLNKTLDAANGEKQRFTMNGASLAAHRQEWQ